jgi:hypothetical protein
VLKKNTNADMDFVWGADAAGMTNPMTTTGDTIYSSSGSTPARLGIGSTGQGLAVVAGIPAWAASATSTLTTTGDMLYASAANTLARRAIGSTGDVLTVAGGVPTWAAPSSGGITLISTTTLTGSSISLTSIPSTYTNLRIVVENYYASAQDYLCVRFNNDSGATSYYMQSRNFDNSTGSNSVTGTTYIGTIGAYNTSAASYLSFMQINIPKYTATSGGQLMVGLGYGGTTRGGWSFPGIYNNRSAAISSIQLFPLTGTMTAGTVYLYGEK